MEAFAHLRISLQDITHATKSFSDGNFIAEGGFGKVYKGEFSNTVGAVKLFNRSKDRADVSFLTEIMFLTSCSHENLISLLGFCDEDEKRILVYEYAGNKSLDFHLTSPNLTWTQRLKICVGAACGLEYLHDPKGTQQRIIHRDIKSANILLDENWNAKVADFGLSRHGPANQERTFVFSEAKGTVGYCDPVYAEDMLLTKESDVYSFGVVLFEVLCSRHCVDQRYNDERRSLPMLVKKRHQEQKLDSIIDVNLRQEIDQNCFHIYVALAFRCLERERKGRPKMKSVVSKLKIALQYQEIFDVEEAERRNRYLQEAECEHLRVPLKMITDATKNFSAENFIAKGRYGKVYKGEFSNYVGAVKLFDRSKDEADVWKEIVLLTSCSHENVISLLGFCDEGEKRILVYEYVGNKSLDFYLTSPSLKWTQRLKICVGAACGLQYLHDPRGTQQTILHRDIKSANILLDQHWNAKIADFGQTTLDFSDAKSILGYCDPMFLETRLLTKESDVYSFGVVLFEVLCSRHCVDWSYNDERLSLPTLVKKCHQEERLDLIIDANIRQEIDDDCFDTFVTLALQCLERERKDRPPMESVVSKLKIALQIQEIFEDKEAERGKRISANQVVLNSKLQDTEFYHLRIPLEIILHATKNFDARNFIVEDGFGKFYRGEFSNTVGAVKLLDRSIHKVDNTFMINIMFLTSYSHENLISLIGYCDEGEKRILVYEYACNKSLEFHLTSTSLRWIQRLKICVGAACGLLYLHDPRGTQRIPHRDIKSANILLDQNWNAKITNFGISRRGPANQDIFSEARDLLGYVHPMYLEGMPLTSESNVYSFGVVLFEVLCSRHCVDLKYTDERRYLPILVKKRNEEQRLDSIIDVNLRQQIDRNCFDTYVALALQCLERQQKRRPSMELVVSKLRIALQLQEIFEVKEAERRNKISQFFLKWTKL